MLCDGYVTGLIHDHPLYSHYQQKYTSELHMGVTSAFYLDASTGWKRREDKRIRPSFIAETYQAPIQNTVIDSDDVFGEARQEYIKEFLGQR